MLITESVHKLLLLAEEHLEWHEDHHMLTHLGGPIDGLSEIDEKIPAEGLRFRFSLESREVHCNKSPVLVRLRKLHSSAPQIVGVPEPDARVCPCRDPVVAVFCGKHSRHCTLMSGGMVLCSVIPLPEARREEDGFVSA